MNIDALFKSLDINKIPDDQLEGYKLGMLRLWKMPSGKVFPVKELHEIFIMEVIQKYLDKNYIYVKDYIQDPSLEGMPNIWLDILTEELARRYHGY